MSEKTIELTSDDLEEFDKDQITRADLVRIVRQAMELPKVGEGGAVIDPLNRLLSAIVIDRRTYAQRDALFTELQHATLGELAAMIEVLKGRHGKGQ